MNTLEILRALQAGAIGIDEVKQELASMRAAPSQLEDGYGLVLSTAQSLHDIGLTPWRVEEPGANEITIQVRASAVNFPDVMCVNGLYPTMPEYPFAPGFEVAGVVGAVGAAVSTFARGDNIIAVTGSQMGGHASHVNVPATNAVHKPDAISFEDACSLPVVFATAGYALELGQLAPSEHVLVQSAAGGCGLVALQLAHLKQCVCYATSSKDYKLDLLRRLGVPHVINYATADFEREIKRLTGGRGVDVVLNMLAGAAIQKGLNCLAPRGRYLEIAAHALKTSAKLDLSRLVHNQTLHSIDLRRLGLEQGFNAKPTLDTMVAMLQAGTLVPIVSRIYPVRRIGEALRHVGSGAHIGKVVVSHTADTMIDRTEQCIEALIEHKRKCSAGGKQVRVAAQRPRAQDGIAIIGMAGQFPKAANLTRLWENIANGVNCISEIPAERWSTEEFYDPNPGARGKTYSKWMGVLEGAEDFDPLFFNISPAEAELMDPQQRLFLETCWRCIEDAGIRGSALSGSRCGVFAGCGPSDYGRNLHGSTLSAQALLGGATSILAARISYLLNLKGPSLAIETACSSSLVAIAQACDSLVLGNCDLALAGGINLMFGPGMHIMTSDAGMLSRDGRCFTFDARANGFVPGEGVGVVLVKRLPDAIRDGDPIAGTIIGWGVNQDGKTNGITAPSVKSQATLEKEVYRRFNIHPDTITLAEAHGTGTQLGDPIEVEALTEAFRAFTDRKAYCALGSVKSNIGHLMAAAGVSGVIKALLALRHGMLPPTINFAAPNPHLSIEGSPFFINTALTPWPRTGSEPRRAAVSSFGFSGTNAHIVIEEYAPGRAEGSTDDGHRQGVEKEAALFVLSAKTEPELRTYAEAMRRFIASCDGVELRDVLYTLQIGREPMEHRLAVAAHSRESLEGALDAYLNNRSSNVVFTGQLKRGSEGLTAFDHDEDVAVLAQSWAQQGKSTKIGELWVMGVNLDWSRLYQGERPRRVSLPSYPFAKKHYALPRGTVAGAAKDGATLHPLVQRNTSDLSAQRYTSVFCGAEFFLADHRIAGQKVLPGAAYLEMVRFAARDALGAEAGRGLSIRNVVWTRPLVVTEPVEVHVRLAPKSRAEIAFEIYRLAGETPTVYCQGIVQSMSAERPTLDLKQLEREGGRVTLTAERCYQQFRDLGLAYGPSHQAIKAIGVGAGEALARLELPAHLVADQSRFVLHPSLVDAALQATLGIAGEADSGPALPFAMEHVAVYAPCPLEAWAVVKCSDGAGAPIKRRKFDVDLCDEAGNVCVAVRGFSMRPLEAAAPAPHETLLFKPTWTEGACVQEVTDRPDQHLIVLCDLAESPVIASEFARATCLRSSSSLASEADRFADYAELLIKALQAIPLEQTVLVQVVGTAGTETLLRGLDGILRTARLENAKVTGQVIVVEESCTPSGVVEILRAEAGHGSSILVRYETGKRLVVQWVERPLSRDAQGPWKDDGVYLISGGAGRVGLLLAEEVAARCQRAKIVLLGRSALDEATRARVAALSDQSARAIYRQVDVADRTALEEVVESVLREYGQINGIVHAAGVLRDGYLRGKRMADVREVLAPKVAGLVNLDLVTQAIPLDVFLVFSSVAGALGNTGQADYAAANAFMDAYAHRRAALVEQGQRSGRTVSINWPLWREGGMQVDEAARRRMRKASGVVELETSDAWRILNACWCSTETQWLAVTGEADKIRSALFPSRSAAGVQRGAAAIDRDRVAAKAKRTLIQTVSQLLKIDADEIDADTELSDYGFDSISLTELADRISTQHGIEVAPTVFFERPTINGVAAFLAEVHGDVLAARYVAAGSALGAGQDAESGAPDAAPRLRFAATSAPMPVHAAAPAAVAVIGMSGRFPQSPDLAAFWRNLQAGADCIEEIPASRWDWRELYGDPHLEENKTRIKHGGFIEGVDEFDPLFFGISPTEAELMDPQQRLLMMYIWRAIEDAGYAPQSLAGSNTAIYIGTGNTGYSTLLERARVAIKGYSSTGAVPSVGPNRMSFLLDLHGPSEPIETACSSSLVAVHRALLAIESGACDAALVGGVNVIVTPDAHIGFGKAGMLSEDGRCKTFSDRADGYARGEGVGMLFLKRLSLAERDGDPIYGVLRGSAENHGGRASSLTAPNPNAQAELLETAYAKAGIDARTVGYIEAHGTGTALGDPVEINGLKGAFKTLYAKTGSGPVEEANCGVGSVKTNIGHLELAAGVAGLIKVLLQLRHKTLVKSLHCDRINPYVDLRDSPFYLVRDTQPWRAIKDASGCDLPRRAGVSSFGFGGVNAHVVIEEYVAPPARATHPPISGERPVVVLLSAKNERQLRLQARQLAAAIGNGLYEDSDLAAIAYTLQVGRDAMDERLGVVVTSLAALPDKLAAFAAGATAIDDLYRGHAKQGKDALAVFGNDEDLEAAIGAWIEKGKHEKLLELWLSGMAFDWGRLYGDAKPRRIAGLPTYPFATERYWVPEMRPAARPGPPQFLHPLAQRNTSDFDQQRYSAAFTGAEWFLTDHVVRGEKTLPGVAHLEMARAALQMAAGKSWHAAAGMRISDVVWLRPVVAGVTGCGVHIALLPEANGAASFAIYGDDGAGYSRGKACAVPVAAAASIDIDALRAQCAARAIGAEECYGAFREMGIDYGPTYRAIKTIHVGERQLVAKIDLSPLAAEAHAGFVLHPGVMDAALQATLGLFLGGDASGPGLPFVLGELELIEACPARAWVWVRYAQSSRVGEATTKLDLDVLDETGKVCVRIKEFSMRAAVPSAVASRDSPGSSAAQIEPVNRHAGERPALPATITRGEAPGGVARPDPDVAGWVAKIRKLLTHEVSSALKVDAQEIDLDTELNEYGFDSIALTEFAVQLNQAYDLKLTPALFFEYPTVSRLAEYLAGAYESQFKQRFNTPRRAPAKAGDADALLPSGEVQPDAASARGHRFAHSVAEQRGNAGAAMEPLAIIGVSGRFPMADDLDAFWNNLVQGRDCIQEVPASRWDWREYYGDPTKEANKTNIKWGGFIAGVGEFDPLFFGISPGEAELMDPQQRLLLTYAWLAIEDAGYAPAELSGTKTAVFIGTGQTGYGSLIDQAGMEIKGYSATGSVPSVAPNRLSYFLNLHGPSEPIETACSSSLVALHRAMAAINDGDCDMAIVGGVNTIVTPASHIAFNKAGMLSADGRCKTFSSKADGYARGEGVGMLMVKRLSAAAADGDHIYGVVRGSAVNHGGRANSLTAPNPNAQAALLEAAYRRAGVDPRTVGYIEVHGTGTALGDPIEINGLKMAFRALCDDPAGAWCGLGSVKTNIGHAELAAGVAGVIKVLLQLQHRTLTKSLHCDEVNPYIDLEHSPFYLVRDTQPWPSPIDARGTPLPRRAGVSSFGFGGANAHVVIEEYIPDAAREASRNVGGQQHLIVLSARDEDRLMERVHGLLAFSKRAEITDADLPAIAYTLQVGREAMEERLALVAASLQEMRERLEAYVAGAKQGDVYRGKVKPHKEALSIFATDQELREAVRKWLERNKLAEVAELWTKGMHVDWKPLYGQCAPRRMSLPGYPFARAHYWVPRSKDRQPPAALLHPITSGTVEHHTGVDIATLLFEPAWRPQALAPTLVPVEFRQRLVILVETGVAAAFIEAAIGATRCVVMDDAPGTIGERFIEYALRLSGEIKSLPAGLHTLIQVVVRSEGEQSLLCGLSGLLRTAQLEHPGVCAQLLEIDGATDRQTVADRLQQACSVPQTPHIRWQGAQSCTVGWHETRCHEGSAAPWRHGGVYLVSGGAGGLGLHIARDIAEHTPGARIVLVGRSVLGEDRRKKLEQCGPNVEYRTADIAVSSECGALIRSVLQRHGRLDGVIHGAGVIRDNLLQNKTADEWQAVLAPKVMGTMNLDQASKDIELDFFVMFSSLAGAMGNRGQADYASGNAFMDAYAAYRRALAAAGKRHGKSVSINWPAWRDGGMRLDAASEKLMTQLSGLIPLDTQPGLQALYAAIATDAAQFLVAHGEPDRIRTALRAAERRAEAEADGEPPEQALAEKVTDALRSTISALLKVDRAAIDGDGELSEYGFDSITLTEFANHLNAQFALDLSPTLLFEYSTVNRLRDYLIGAHRAALERALHGAGGAGSAGALSARTAAMAGGALRNADSSAARVDASAIPAHATAEPIAIIGMSGRFPKARDLDQFWENLRHGAHCITEVPRSRWDWREFYGDPHREVNKTRIKWGGFIDGVDEFDPLFFGISPIEAEAMDPQQRLLMTYAWLAIEDAGYAPHSLSGTRTAVLVGTGNTGYGSLAEHANRAIQGYSSTGAVPSIGPNRVSYLLNLHGPSEPVETACSSSLVALHRAVTLLQDGSCDMAIVGGVNTIVTPGGHIGFDKAGMLSADGRCKTFAQDADGYVRGEGVGMLFLKRRSDAERAGDHIYGLIRGSAENHGGRAHSLTAPNPTAQAELIEAAYAKAGVDPATIGYIEVHGTGTALGDPIEIDGLKSAFKSMRERGGGAASAHHCGLGSVKSNIGHLELAAGVAGVIKVLLQLKHQTLTKSLHCETLNPYIKLDGSPFYVVRETGEWAPMSDADGNPVPRRAGVSSFGFGGVNAHVVLEEHVPARSIETDRDTAPTLIVLSARTLEQLKEQAAQLLASIRKRGFSSAELRDVAYTLQTGREAMAERAAFVVGSMAMLERALEAFVAGVSQPSPPDQVGEVQAMARAWMRGARVDWSRLYLNVKPNRVSLPGYPFARDRYWLTATAAGASSAAARAASGPTETLHPLLHQNVSVASAQRFTARFSGREFFLADHRVLGMAVLPGAAHLEMARAAVARVLAVDDSRPLQLRHITWLQPLNVGDGAGVSVDVAVQRESCDEISYRVESARGDSEGKTHSQGRGRLMPAAPDEPERRLDIAAIKHDCPRRMGAAEIYQLFSNVGIEYGPAHRALEEIHIGPGQVLAKLTLPDVVRPDATAFVMHPSMIDAALQASLGLMLDAGIDRPALPFALERLDVLGRHPAGAWAWLRYSSGSVATDSIGKWDIDICAESGAVCVQMRKFSARLMEAMAVPASLRQVGGATPAHPGGAIASRAPGKPQRDGDEAGARAIERRVRELVRACVTQALGVDAKDIRNERNLVEYGVDSIIAVNLINLINDACGTTLPTTVLFDYSSVDALSRHLAIDQHEAVARLMESRVEGSTSYGEPVAGPQEASGAIHAPPWLQDTNHRVAAVTQDEPIAVIGMSARYAQSDSAAALWRHLAAGDDLVGEVRRWDLTGHYATTVETGKDRCKRGSFIDGIDLFDADFFNISALEARYMDPQQRLFLEESWTALEDAGYAGTAGEARRCGVFVGCTGGDYRSLIPAQAPAQAFWGNAASVIPARIAYFLDLQGPAVAIDTACSSSLVAIHSACQSLWRRETDMALAGGVQVQSTPAFYVLSSRGGMLSPTGRCHSFDERADGFVPGEGVGVVVLKRLSDALAEGDHIYGVICGTGVNQDGTTNGITAPSSKSQERLECEVYERYRIHPDSIQMVEAHGTGTKLGDPIEFAALTRAFRRYTQRQGYCALGSIKTNLGHAATAAGVAGVIKVLLSLQHKQIPASLHHEVCNTRIDMQRSPFYVNRQTKVWETVGGQPRRAAVSSFGFSGTNAHMVLEEAPALPDRMPERKPGHLIALSARTAEGLREQAWRLVEFLESDPESADAPLRCGDISYTLLVGRRHFDHRLTLVIQDRRELLSALRTWLEKGKAAKAQSAQIQPDEQGQQPALRRYANECLKRCVESADQAEYLESLHAVADLYLHGYALDFRALFANDRCARISLPTYPFTRKSYWVPESEGRCTPPKSSAAPRRTQPSAEHERRSAATPLTDEMIEACARRLVRECVSKVLETDASEIRNERSFAEYGVDSIIAVNLINSISAALGVVLETTLLFDYNSVDALSRHIGSEHRGAVARLLQSADDVEVPLAENRAGHTVACASLSPDGMSDAPVVAPIEEPIEALPQRDARDEKARHADGRSEDIEQAHAAQLAPLIGNVLLAPVWEPTAIGGDASPATTDAIVLIGGVEALRDRLQSRYGRLQAMQIAPDETIAAIAKKLVDAGPIDHLLWVAPAVTCPLDQIIAQQRLGVLQVFRIVKALAAVGYGGRKLSWTLVTYRSHATHRQDPVDPTHAGIHGLAGCMAKEYANWRIRLCDLPSAETQLDAQDMFRLPFDAQGDAFVYRNGQWLQQRLVPCEDTHGGAPAFESLYRRGGVYVVVGGAGGIGEVWTEYLIRRYQANVVWLGRRPVNPEIERRLASLGRLGPAPTYLRADATKLGELRSACAEIKRRFGVIHGVAHSAIVLLDQSLATMTEERFVAGLAAKVDVSVRMAQVFQSEALDFMLFFSSMNSFVKAAGQSNYAAGCTFKDAFSQHLAQTQRWAAKTMNWGYWGEVGVVASVEVQERMARAGIGSIAGADANAALEALLAGPVDQMALLKTLKPLPLHSLRDAEKIGVNRGSAQGALRRGRQYIRATAEAARELATRNDAPTSTMLRLLERLLWAQITAANRADAAGSLAHARSRLDARYRKWFDESIATLMRHGYIRPQGAGYETVQRDGADLDDLWRRWEQEKDAWASSPTHTAMAALAERTLRALPEVITGKRAITEVVFPGGSMALVEGLYKNNPVADHFNDALAESVLAYVRSRAVSTPEARLRILEVGAGTGGSSARIFEQLRPYRHAIEEYCYTDLSKAFLLHARTAYGPANPFLRYEIFDVTKPLAEQTIAAGTYDIVVASNVLHATPDVRWALRNVKAALAAGGAIMLNELSDRSLFAHVTFGLFDGWWLHADGALRIPGCPALAPESWRSVLLSEGFRDVSFPAEAAHPLGQQIILGESDGVVRQKRLQPVREMSQLCGEVRDKSKDAAGDPIADEPYRATWELGTQAAPRRPSGFRTSQREQPEPDVASAANDRWSHGKFIGSDYHRVVLERPGQVEQVKLATSPCAPLEANQLRIAVKAFSLNFGDLLCVKGLYPTMPPYPFTPGFEASGVVVETGAAVRAVKPGDAVIAGMGDTLGGHASMIVCTEEQVFLKPEPLSFEDACAMPAVSITMIDAFSKAQVKRGERMLIQTATGGAGLMAVQLAQHYGAEIFGTAGSQHKLDYLTAIGVRNVINYQEQDFAAEVKRLTGGEGVDVIINTLSGDALQKGLRCLRSGGRYIEIAMTALKSAKSVDLSVLTDNQAFHSVDLRKLARANPELMKAHQREFVRLVNAGTLKATICRSFPIYEIKEAYRCLENRRNIGKVVVQIPKTHDLRDAAAAAEPEGVAQVPELVRLNHGKSGRPVFWLHGALGVVEIYQPIAHRSARPFYGIRPRGLIGDKAPLRGLNAMAAYYVEIIKSVQKEGPYDLGGYSMGGILAYEVARQLQAQNLTVASIVMLDAPDSTHLHLFKFSKRTAMLQAVNTALLATIPNQAEKLQQTLIHRNEAAGWDDEVLLQQLISIAQRRGLYKEEAQLRASIKKSSEVLEAYEVERFRVEPLSDPAAVSCYFFRNRAGRFFGDLEPYLTMTPNELQFDQATYWEEWRRNLPDLHMLDVDSSSHLTLLSEERAAAVIAEFCAQLYSGAGESRHLAASAKQIPALHE